MLPFPGWTLPGVFTLGAAQVALKYQGCAIGQRVVFAGTGPLLYLVAYQYAKAGARGRRRARHRAASPTKLARLARACCAAARCCAKGVYYLGWLRLHGVPVHGGVRRSKA